MDYTVDLNPLGIRVAHVLRNVPAAVLYEFGTAAGDKIVSSGALATCSGVKTGRSPKDKRIVDNPASNQDVWWGPVNIKLPESSFVACRKRAVDYLNRCERLYVVDGYAGWDPKQQLKIRIICARPYHALFMRNMLIRPEASDRGAVAAFGQPDYVIYNAGEEQADPTTPGMTSGTSVSLSFERGEMVILGTQYAGEMKKGVFTIMHYLMPKQEVLSMHCSANAGPSNDVTLFFGLSGTGKTTLSADVRRDLIGDDEHCWSSDGVFNIEGGCYAKCIGLSASREPQIFSSIRFGAILENVVIDDSSRDVKFDDASLTENTRVSYPIDFIPHARIPCVAGHPKNIVFLTADAFGVLPPVARLTPEQAMYHFISGYTAKVAGTEVGVLEPQATFSACFGAAFLVWHPTKYAEMLADRMRRHKAQAWLVNTGWSGGAYGAGARMPLEATRAIIDSIHNGTLEKTPFTPDPVFGIGVPRKVAGVPDAILTPRITWADRDHYDHTAQKLVGLFHDNFKQYASAASEAVCAAAPKMLAR